MLVIAKAGPRPHFTTMVSPKGSSGTGRTDNPSGGGYGGTAVVVVKVLLVLIILFLLPKLVLTSTAGAGPAVGTAAAVAATVASPIAAGARPTGRERRIKNRRQLNREYYQIRSSCENESPDCADVIFEESVPCITRCVSSACHDRVYGDIPLEPGEVDRLRYAEFEVCAKREVKEAARLERIERRRRAAAPSGRSQ